MTTLGAVFLPQFAPERLRSCAEAADRCGLEELWLWEDCFFESGIASASAALAWTERLTVGIGLLPAPLRNVALTAMEVATLCRLYPGRVRIGVGHGVQPWMHQVGAAVESPLTLLREYVKALRSLLRGEQVTAAGRYVNLDAVALSWPPTVPPEILCGAVGPRTLFLSGASADGTILVSGTTPETLADAAIRINAGRSAAGRSEPHALVQYMHAARGEDAAARLAAAASRWGYRGELGDALPAGVEAAVRAVGRYTAAGATTIVFQPTEDEPDPEGFVRFVAEDVRSLVCR